MPKVALGDNRKQKNDSILQKIAIQRVLHDMTNPQVAAATGIDRGVFYNRLKDPDTFKLSELRRICALFKISMNELLEKED